MASSSALITPAASVVSGPPSLAVAQAVHRGLSAHPKALPPWLFYDESGSQLFEEITSLPEYYLTRTERALFAAHADAIFDLCGSSASTPLTVVELGAGTARKTGVLLRVLAQRQSRVVYQPIDISPTALDEAGATLTGIPGLAIQPLVANYITDPVPLERADSSRVLALYIGSSIGNFSPAEARAILANLRANLQPGDSLLLGTDLAPCAPNGHAGKPVSRLLAAYNDARGVTAEFNRNLLRRLNRELGADFRPFRFRHIALWNEAHSRIEMHLESLGPQTVQIPAACGLPRLTAHFRPGETIHTENSYKFTRPAVQTLLQQSGFDLLTSFVDPEELFAVNLAHAV